MVLKSPLDGLYRSAGKMFAIGLTGLPRSGKDSVADYLVERYGFKKFVQSEIAAEELRQEGKPDTKINRSYKVDEMREKFGEDIFVRINFEKAKKEGVKKAVFCGLWSLADIKFLRKNCNQFVLVAVKAEKNKRFARRSKQDAQSWEQFFERDKHDLEVLEAGQVIAAAHQVIENNSDREDLKNKVDILMKNI